jgi:hypothetical protein
MSGLVYLPLRNRGLTNIVTVADLLVPCDPGSQCTVTHHGEAQHVSVTTCLHTYV